MEAHVPEEMPFSLWGSALAMAVRAVQGPGP